MENTFHIIVCKDNSYHNMQYSSLKSGEYNTIINHKINIVNKHHCFSESNLKKIEAVIFIQSNFQIMCNFFTKLDVTCFYHFFSSNHWHFHNFLGMRVRFSHDLYNKVGISPTSWILLKTSWKLSSQSWSYHTRVTPTMLEFPLRNKLEFCNVQSFLLSIVCK